MISVVYIHTNHQVKHNLELHISFQSIILALVFVADDLIAVQMYLPRLEGVFHIPQTVLMP